MVLPAPFGPRITQRSALSTLHETPSRIVVPLRVRETSVSCSTTGMASTLPSANRADPARALAVGRAEWSTVLGHEEVPAMAEGTKDDPWVLTTAPGTSEYRMWRDRGGSAAIVCQVGSTTLRYRPEAIEDLRRGSGAGDWVPLGAADEQKAAADGTVEAFGATRATRSAAGTGSARATAGGSACTCRRCSRRSGWPS